MLPPAAVESLKQRGRKGGGGWFGAFGGKAADPLDVSLPKHLEVQGQECARLGKVVRELAGAGQYQEALGTARERLALCERTYGVEHVMTATCLNDVATFEQAFGRFDESEALFERASRLQRKLLGDCHPHSVATLQNLASLYEAKGDVSKKEGMQALVQALKASAQAAPAGR